MIFVCLQCACGLSQGLRREFKRVRYTYQRDPDAPNPRRAVKQPRSR